MSNYRVQNPATGEIVETFPEATDAEIESTVAAAHSTYLTWKDTDIQDRPGILRQAEFAAVLSAYYGGHGRSLAADYRIPSTLPGTARIEALPIGALLGVMPWNFPYYQVARCAAPNLVLGNPITLKHADVGGRSG